MTRGGFWRFDLPGGESTSAARRRVEQERDEALRQRDEFVAAADKLNDSWLDLKAELASAQTELDAARKRIAELERPWVVARDGGRDCVRCDQEIRRGEAYEVLPGVDQLCHCHCPIPGVDR